jgi:hypothetical protein
LVFALTVRQQRHEAMFAQATRVTSVRNGVGTALEQATMTQAYTANGQRDWVEDAPAVIEAPVFGASPASLKDGARNRR